MQTSALDFERFAPFGPLLLRLGLGAIFVAHAWGKIFVFGLDGTASFFAAHGLPSWAALPVILIELLGGVGLMLGVATRIVALALVPVMLGALVPHIGNGWMFTNPGGGWEYVAFLIVALLAQASLGSGAYALTPRLRKQAPPRPERVSDVV